MVKRGKTDKPDVIIYGLALQWKARKKLLEQIFNIVGYSGHTVRDMDGYIRPDELCKAQFEYIYVTSSDLFDDIKAELIEDHGIREEAIIGEKDLYLYTESLMSRVNYYKGSLMSGIGTLEKWLIQQLKMAERRGVKLPVTWYEVLQELKLVKSKNTEEKTVVVIGANKYGKYFAEQISHCAGSFWGITTVNPDDMPRDMIPHVRDINELVYEDTEKLKIYIIDPYKVVQTIGVLLGMGIKRGSIKVLGEVFENGTRLQNVFDVDLGYTWKDNGLPGFALFGGEGKDKAENVFRIVTLGGSTTDPTFVNIKSWPEILYEKLYKINKNIEIYNGGLAAYTSVQELQKLIRDITVLKPDMVISYSGFNDARRIYYEPGHPFILSYKADILRKNIRKKQIRNTIQGGKITEYTLGLEKKSDLWEHWLDCERMMHAICQEYGITFYGILQPYNRNDRKALGTYARKKYYDSFYRNAKKTIRAMGENQGWLKDFTDIFDGEENIFFDLCHVYEKGNNIIASRMMPYVLRAMRGEQEL